MYNRHLICAKARKLFSIPHFWAGMDRLYVIRSCVTVQEGMMNATKAAQGDSEGGGGGGGGGGKPKKGSGRHMN